MTGALGTGARAMDLRQNPAHANNVSVARSSPLLSAAEGYERWASTYDLAPNPLLAREERHLMPLLPRLRDERVLDLACGTGRWLDKLTGNGVRLGAGVDCSMAMLRAAAKKKPIAGRLAQATCNSLPFRAASFDLAICSFALGHIDPLESMAREIARVTKSGADLFVSDLHPDAFAWGWRVGFRDDGVALEIEVMPRSARTIAREFELCDFECVSQETLHLGDPEKAIFLQAGKADAFAEACSVPAILVSHFKRRD